MENAILEPVIVLVAWTLVIFVWMMSTRLPYLMKNNISAQELQNASDVAMKLPGKERRVSDNYNHLHEQPTIFYALAIALALTGEAGTSQILLAWVYVASRVIHSIIQCTYNSVMHRFLLFFVGSAALVGMVAIEIASWSSVTG
jgi:hypothetical protein